MKTATATKTYAVVERIRPVSRARLRTRVRAALARTYTPPPKLTLSEWADANRYLSAESAALPGRWKTSNEPLAKGIMDACSDPMVEKVTVMCAAQIVKTETLLNAIGYFAHGDPAPILLVQPTVEMGEAFSKDRLAPMIRDTPVIRDLFKSSSRDSSDTILHKAFPGGRVTIAGANAPAGLASRPIRVVLCDEVDRYPASAGREGDPVGLAEKRTTTFWNRKIVLVSTPTIKGESRIEESYLEGDQRRYHVPCSHCEAEQSMKWAQVKWNDSDPETAAYYCEACGCEWSEADRLDAISRGRWIAEAEFKGHASFHASQLASRRVPLMRIVKEFLEAKRAAGTERLKQWINTVLAETWSDGGERADPTGLYARREEYSAGYAEEYGPTAQPSVMPVGVGMVTAAVDIQGNRWELEFAGWGAHEERWSLDYIVHFADPTAPAFWEALDEAIRRRFKHPSGMIMKPAIICIDSGNNTQAVHEFCRPRYGLGVRAIKGAAGPARPIWPKKATKNAAKNTDTFILGVDNAKASVQARLMAKDRGPGFCHFPKRYPYDESYFAQVTVEKAVTKYKFGRPYKVWMHADGERNEAWDCMVYNYAAYFASGVDVARRLAELQASVDARSGSLEPTKIPIPGAQNRRVRSGGVQA